MIIERTDDEIIIKLLASVEIEDLQNFLNFARYKELTSDFAVQQDETNKIITNISNREP